MAVGGERADEPSLGRSTLPRDFWLYLASRFCTATGSMLLRAAVAWHVYALSHSAFHLGLIGLVQFLPAPALSRGGGRNGLRAGRGAHRGVARRADTAPVPAAGRRPRGVPIAVHP